MTAKPKYIYTIRAVRELTIRANTDDEALEKAYEEVGQDADLTVTDTDLNEEDD